MGESRGGVLGAAITLGIGGIAFAMACGVTIESASTPTPPDGPSSRDAEDRDDGGGVEPTGEAGIDAAPPPACPDGVICDGVCLVGKDCSACGTGRLFCRVTGACVSECAACTGGPVECWACAGASTRGSCEVNQGTGYCLGGDSTYPNGAGHCECAGDDLGKCPGEAHVCAVDGGSARCVTCGESGYGTMGLGCKNGRTCDATMSPPRCR